jgi:hypothetical protein
MLLKFKKSLFKNDILKKIKKRLRKKQTKKKGKKLEAL